jgi:hypothetical protein
MWLKDDLEQLKQNWKQSPWWVRLWMVVSLFLAVSSLASLSETVADWKGFFLDAIVFYREWVSSPLRELLARAGFRYTAYSTDALIFVAMFASITIRSEYMGADWNQPNERAAFWFYVIFISMIVGFAFYWSANRAIQGGVQDMMIGAALVYAPYIILAKKHRKYRLVLYHTLFVILVVCVFGAFSTGLSA